MTILNGITRLYPSEGLHLMEASQIRSDTFIDGELSFVLQHWGLAGLLQLWEGLIHWRIELSLIVWKNAGERTTRHHERRLMEGGVRISKARSAVRAAGACSKAHIYCRFP